MKIAYMTETYHPDINGTVTYIDTSVRYLLEKGHEILICAPYTKGCVEADEKMEEQGFKVARFPAMLLDPFIDIKNKRMTIPLYGNVTGKVAKILSEFQADIVHMQTDLYLSYAGWRWARRNSVPTIMTAHTQMLTQWDAHMPWAPKSVLKPILTFLFKPLYEGMDYLLAPADGMDKYLEENHGITEPLEICLTGIDPKAFVPVDSTFERENSVFFMHHPRIKDRKRLLFAGRITPEKNIDFLLEALAEILKTRDDVELMLAGHSTLIKAYQKKAEDMGIANHLTFLGSVPHQEMSRLYAITDVFTFASKSETQGLATTEAVYFGVPSVVVSALGSDTVLEGDKGGFLVEDNTSLFAGKVNELLNNETLYRQKKAEALARHEELSFSHTVDQLVTVYEKVVRNYGKVSSSKPIMKATGESRENIPNL